MCVFCLRVAVRQQYLALEHLCRWGRSRGLAGRFGLRRRLRSLRYDFAEGRIVTVKPAVGLDLF